MSGEIKEEYGLYSTLYIIELLEKIERELKHCRVFVASKERMHPTGLSLYDELQNEVSDAITAYRQGKWIGYLAEDLNATTLTREEIDAVLEDAWGGVSDE